MTISSTERTLLPVVSKPVGWSVAEETLGERVRALRLAQRLTQAELARLAHVETQAVNLIEKGKRRRPELRTLLGLAEALGTTPAYLEYGIETEDGPLPPLRTYLRRVAGLEPDQINAVERTVQAMESERRLRELEARYDAEPPATQEPIPEPSALEPEAAFQPIPPDMLEGYPESEEE